MTATMNDITIIANIVASKLGCGNGYGKFEFDPRQRGSYGLAHKVAVLDQLESTYRTCVGESGRDINDVVSALIVLTPEMLLKCCRCGGGTRGRQWRNCDSGFGICVDCVKSRDNIYCHN